MRAGGLIDVLREKHNSPDGQSGLNENVLDDVRETLLV
jgi:hypothetical protein